MMGGMEGKLAAAQALELTTSAGSPGFGLLDKGGMMIMMMTVVVVVVDVVVVVVVVVVVIVDWQNDDQSRHATPPPKPPNPNISNKNLQRAPLHTKRIACTHSPNSINL
jgi:hypothetical protein